MGTVKKDETMGAGLAAILLLSLVSNFILILVIWKRQRLRTVHHSLMFAIALGDILIAGSWTGLSVAGLMAGWDLPGVACRLQSFMLTLAQMLSAFLLAALGLERALRMLKPSRHKVIFGNVGRKLSPNAKKAVAFLVLGVLLFCGIMSSIHLYGGSLPVAWISDQRSCGAQFTESLDMLDFTFCLDHAIPYWVISLPAFIAAFIKLFIARRRSTQQGEIVLERNSYAPGDAYSSRLAKTQEKFKTKTSTSSQKPKKLGTLGKRTYTPRGYTELEDWDSDIETEGHDKDSEADGRQRLHLLPKPEYTMLSTAAVLVLVTSLFWFPWIIARFMWNKTPRDPPPDWFGVMAVLLMHAASLVKLPVNLIVSPYFRSATFKTLCCCRK